MFVVNKTLVHSIILTCQVFYCQVPISNVVSVCPYKRSSIPEPPVRCAWNSERDTGYGDGAVRSCCGVLWLQDPLGFSCRKQFTHRKIHTLSEVHSNQFDSKTTTITTRLFLDYEATNGVAHILGCRLHQTSL